MDELLKQYRESRDIEIKENPSTATFSYAPLVSNGRGGYIQDPSGTVTSYSETVRLSHESSGVHTYEDTPAGMGTSFTLFVVGRYNSNIIEGITITVNSKKYKVGPVDKEYIKGSLVGIQAKLTEVI